MQAAALLIAPCIAQTTIHVPADAPTIQSAIDHASNGDTVLVAPDTYTENINFKGKAITVTSGAKVFADATSTIITGATDGPVVVFGTNEPSTAVLWIHSSGWSRQQHFRIKWRWNLYLERITHNHKQHCYE